MANKYTKSLHRPAVGRNSPANHGRAKKPNYFQQGIGLPWVTNHKRP